MSCLNLAFVLGEKVERASATLPQTTTQSLFTISGGRVVVTSLFGKVTVDAGSTTATVAVNPTAAGPTSTIGNESISSWTAGYVMSYDKVGSGWVSGVSFGVGCQPFIVSEGVISLQTNSSVSGEMSWTLTYVALDDGATVAAA